MAGETELQRLYSNPRVGDAVLGFGILMFLLFLGCAGFLLFGADAYKRTALIIGLIWVVGVPVYFFIEHVMIFRVWGDHSQYEQFKRVQDLATKIWAAAIVVLSACYSANFSDKFTFGP